MEELEKEFIPYDRALRIKSLGFDEPCFGWYEHNSNFYYCYQEGLVPPSPSKKLIKGCCLAPTFSQAFRWFRETHDLACYIYRTNFTSYEWVIDIDESYAQDSELDYTSYEKAELACLDKLIEIVEQKQKEDGK